MQGNKDVCGHCGETVGEAQACSSEQAPKCTNYALCSSKPSTVFLGTLDDGAEFREQMHARYG